MSALMIARLSDPIDGRVAWSLVDEASATVEGGVEDSLDAFLASLGGRGTDADIAAILPGEHVALRVIPAAPKDRSKFLAASNLLFEDELAEPVDQCHIAVHRHGEDGRAFAVNRKLIEDVAARFRAAGVPLSFLTVDFDCLGGAPTRPAIFVERRRILLSDGHRGFAAEPALAFSAISEMYGNAEEVNLSVYGDLAKSSGFGAVAFERVGPASDDALLGAAATHIRGGNAVNLLQGAFRPARRPVFDLSTWRRPALMAASLAAGFLALTLVDGMRASRLSSSFEAEASRLHAQTFPEAATSDPRAHAQSILASGGTGASFLQLANQLGVVVEEKTEVSIDRIRFDAARGQFVFTVSSISNDEIEAFRQALAARGVTVNDTGGFRRSGAVWVGEMTARI